MSIAVSTAGLLRPYVDKVPADKDVTAGYIGFAVFIFLCLAVALLGFSLVKHLRRAEQNLAPRDETPPEAPGSPDSSNPAPPSTSSTPSNSSESPG